MKQTSMDFQLTDRVVLSTGALSQALTLRSGITCRTGLRRPRPASISPIVAAHRPTSSSPAYRALALSGAGLLISGNVMVDGAGWKHRATW